MTEFAQKQLFTTKHVALGILHHVLLWITWLPSNFKEIPKWKVFITLIGYKVGLPPIFFVFKVEHQQLNNNNNNFALKMTTIDEEKDWSPW